VREKEKTTIALLGTDTVVGWAILLILREEGYEIRWWKPPTGLPEDLMEGVDLLLIPPDLIHRLCEESLAALRGKHERIDVPVLSLTAAEEGLLHEEEEVRVVPWPINIEELAREIEGALNTTHSGK
jgi:hypothetical protein